MASKARTIGYVAGACPPSYAVPTAAAKSREPVLGHLVRCVWVGRSGRRATGRRACRHAIAVVVVVLALTGCTDDGADPAAEAEAGTTTAPAETCGPVTYAEVRGRAPSYGPRSLGRFANDHAMCAGVWAPGADRWLVPQGMAVAGDGTAYLAGFDGTKPARQRYCSVERIDLRTGRLMVRNDPVRGFVGGAAPIICRHGGGLVLDEHGLWLAETVRLWLLDPETLEVRRGWVLEAPVRGSFAVHDGEGRLGLGRFSKRTHGQVDWFDPSTLLAPGTVLVRIGDASSSVWAPGRSQGAVFADLDGRGAGLWFVRSHSACGVLVGPHRQRRGFIPGGESMSLDQDGRLWVASESGSRLYQKDGRPMTPQPRKVRHRRRPALGTA